MVNVIRSAVGEPIQGAEAKSRAHARDHVEEPLGADASSINASIAFDERNFEEASKQRPAQTEVALEAP
jgi:hypothetical protein